MSKQFSRKDKQFSKQFFEKLSIDQVAPEAGKALISEPFLLDPHFTRTVLYLTEHNPEGTLGFIVNRSTELTVSEVVPDLTALENHELFYGGPVGQDQLFYLHLLGEELDGAIKVGDKLWWGGEFEKLKELAINGRLNETNIKFFIGYSGWAPNQLADELKQKSWIVADINEELLFAKLTKEFWTEALAGLGKKYKVMSNFPVDPTMN